MSVLASVHLRSSINDLTIFHIFMKFNVGVPYRKFQENWLLEGQNLDKGINEITSHFSHFLTG